MGMMIRRSRKAQEAAVKAARATSEKEKEKDLPFVDVPEHMNMKQEDNPPKRRGRRS